MTTALNNIPRPPPSSLRSLAIRGSIWTFSGYGTSQALRLASNVVLARLLFPEAFGLMALVALFMQGLTMFSDVGIKPSIIQNPRGDDPAFLNTAWTIQVVRGVVLWLIACVGAYPFALVYGEPLLAWMLPVAGLTAVIAGFNSTALATANRRIHLGGITMAGLIAQIASIVTMVTLAWMYETVWALVAGGLVNATTKMALSHAWLAEIRNRLMWDREAAHSLFRFGRWIFVSTVLTFLAGKLDRLLLGGLLGMATFGVLTVALLIKDAASSAVVTIGSNVIFPAYSRLERENPKRLRHVLRMTRIMSIGAVWAFALPLGFLGDYVIQVLYDERYAAAGWMLQILVFGQLGAIVSQSYGNALLAKGRSGIIAILLAVQIALMLAAIVIGWRYAGLAGVIVGLAAAEWAKYPFHAFFAARLRIWQPEIDLPALGLGIIVVVWAVRVLIG